MVRIAPGSTHKTFCFKLCNLRAQIAIETNRQYNENTIFLLIARDHNKLVQVKEEMHKKESKHNELKNKIITLKLDFFLIKNTAELVNILQISLKDEKIGEINELFVFYNHGTLQLYE